MRENKRHPMTSLLLKKARKESNLKQSEFIEKHSLDVTQATFSRWESGHIAVPVDVLLSLGILKPALELN
ncbi:helix-turn-helix transcriptional regulator [Vibrio sp. Isolate32]|uniref:helix-turn-helix domain-containing protein n=1 Tax=Vibrio sp. Isolate32 TaxID=2908538 RepID=UPI001EFDD618|nr:helix-turn-helix transcriptional regulator [Vibrio sp. Isolate32]MCG9553814.1 helix-turn-helix transcriptional regulator [Vibrio sp. Isolate32]